MKIRHILTLVAAASVLVPINASADHLDVIEMKFQEVCSLSKLMPIVADFNEWGKAYGYSAQIASPLQTRDVTTFYWLGTSANAASFGAAWDAWRDALPDSNSVPAKLQARFEQCTINVSRSGYDLF